MMMSSPGLFYQYSCTNKQVKSPPYILLSNLVVKVIVRVKENRSEFCTGSVCTDNKKSIVTEHEYSVHVKCDLTSMK